MLVFTNCQRLRRGQNCWFEGSEMFNIDTWNPYSSSKVLVGGEFCQISAAPLICLFCFSCHSCVSHPQQRPPGYRSSAGCHGETFSAGTKFAFECEGWSCNSRGEFQWYRFCYFFQHEFSLEWLIDFSFYEPQTQRDKIQGGNVCWLYFHIQGSSQSVSACLCFSGVNQCHHTHQFPVR